MFNPVIIIALVIQAVISKFSRMAGAVIGYVITTGILLWGLSLYGEGGQIAVFGIALSEPIFFIVCLVWYGFDTKEFLAATTASKGQLPVPATPDEGTPKQINEPVEPLTPEEIELNRIKREKQKLYRQKVFKAQGRCEICGKKLGIIAKFKGEIRCPTHRDVLN